MIIENFSKQIFSSKIVDTYVATAFFATLIFFVLNANVYTPLEMIAGVIFITITFKGLCYIMISLVILLFNLNNKKESIEFDQVSARIDGLLNDLSLQSAKSKSASVMNETAK
jgi:hypothetical protein